MVTHIQLLDDNGECLKCDVVQIKPVRTDEDADEAARQVSNCVKRMLESEGSE